MADTAPADRRGRGRPKGPGDAQLVQGLTTLYTGVGTVLFMVNPIDGQIILTHAPTMAGALVDFARQDKRLYHALQRLVTGNVYLQLVLAHAIPVGAIAVNHGYLPGRMGPLFGLGTPQREGYEQRQDHYGSGGSAGSASASASSASPPTVTSGPTDQTAGASMPGSGLFSLPLSSAPSSSSTPMMTTGTADTLPEQIRQAIQAQLALQNNGATNTGPAATYNPDDVAPRPEHDPAFLHQLETRRQ